jgi:hypothetical protein
MGKGIRLVRMATLVLLFNFAALPARAGDHEFKAAVQQIESYCHTRESHPHLLAFALLVARPLYPFGVRGVKLALFESPGSCATSQITLSRLLAGTLGQGWSRIVRTVSQPDGDITTIYARVPRPNDKDVGFLIVDAEPSETVLISARLRLRAFDRLVSDCRGGGRISR